MSAQPRQPDKDFLGIGWAYPIGLDSDQSISTAMYEDDIRQSIRIILGTNRGERVMRPEFGAGLNEFLFAPVSFSTMELVRTRVSESLIDWEPRIDVLEVKVEAAGPASQRLDIDMRYRVRATNTLHNLVYPFYLQEGAET